MPNSDTIKDTYPDLLELHSDSCSVYSAEHSVSSSTKTDDTLSVGSKNEIDEVVEVVEGKIYTSFSVQGLYTRDYSPTPEEEESMKRRFICCRRRMRTRPFENLSSKDPTDEIADDVDNSKEKEEDDDSDVQEEYETAMFVPEIGLVGPKFWHETDTEAKVVREDRAVLFQSRENYERLLSHDRLKSCFDDIDYMENPTFGEQVIVNGIEISDLAIGDVFEIKGGHSPLVVEITAPRKPCSYMNLKHGTANGAKGIQNYSHHNILAGWFARVLVAGELREGMEFIRKAHPNPKWTLDYTHEALYGEGTRLESLMNVSSWNRDRKELLELIALPQLGQYEWKNEGRKRLFGLDGVRWNTVRIDLIDPQAKTPYFILQLFFVTEILQRLTAALKYFGII